MLRLRAPARPAPQGDPTDPLDRSAGSTLTRWRTRGRRTVLARRRPLAAAAAALAVGTGVSAARPPDPPTTQVLVAARDLPAGSLLAAGDVRTVDLPVDLVPAGALDALPRSLTGATLTGPVREGETLTDWRVVRGLAATALPAGDVLTSVRLADPAALVLLETGRRIDLVAADPAGEQAATVVAADALVVAVPAGDTGDGALGVGSGPVVVLAVPPATALALADAAVRSQLSPLVGQD